jgi:hypothetical protein
MASLEDYKLLEFFLCVGFMWPLMGIAWWPIAQIMMKLAGIKSVFGHNLNFMDCALKGPVAGVISLYSFQCTEYAQKFNAERGSE